MSTWQARMRSWLRCAATPFTKMPSGYGLRSTIFVSRLSLPPTARLPWPLSAPMGRSSEKPAAYSFAGAFVRERLRLSHRGQRHAVAGKRQHDRGADVCEPDTDLRNRTEIHSRRRARTLEPHALSYRGQRGTIG